MDQARTIERLRADLSRLSLQSDEMIHDIYAWILERSQRGELRQPDNFEAWKLVREGYMRVRHRRREVRSNLAGDDNWCTTAFLGRGGGAVHRLEHRCH